MTLVISNNEKEEFYDMLSVLLLYISFTRSGYVIYKNNLFIYLVFLQHESTARNVHRLML